ncbi:hypothetical protein ACP70R_001128 [Stipagrostis hirtigluma subsp. patula]
MSALPPSSAAGPGDSAGASEVPEGSGGLSEDGPAASAVGDSEDDSPPAEGSSAASALSGAADASDGEVEGLDDEPLGELDGAFPDEALPLGDAAPEPEVGASEGVDPDLEAGALAEDALGGGAPELFSGGAAAGALSDFPGDLEGAFDGADEPEDDGFGEADGACASAA